MLAKRLPLIEMTELPNIEKLCRTLDPEKVSGSKKLSCKA